MWIAPDSPVPFGRGTKYRPVRLALPYLIMFVVFAADAGGQLQLTAANECFFRVEPLQDPGRSVVLSGAAQLLAL